MEYRIRRIAEDEFGVLEDFLYEAIFVPEGGEPPAREIIEQPALRVYLDGFGKRESDTGLAAVWGDRIVGAVWARIMNDYGHIDDETPSLAISVCKAYRGFGIGTALMKAMIAALKAAGYRQASLAVQKANYAVRMYEKVGFEVVAEKGEEYIMVCRF